MNLMLLSNVYFVILIVAIFLLYLVEFILKGINKQNAIVILVLSILEVVLHLGLFAMCLILKVTNDEIVFWLLISLIFAFVKVKIRVE